MSCSGSIDIVRSGLGTIRHQPLDAGPSASWHPILSPVPASRDTNLGFSSDRAFPHVQPTCGMPCGGASIAASRHSASPQLSPLGCCGSPAYTGGYLLRVADWWLRVRQYHCFLLVDAAGGLSHAVFAARAYSYLEVGHPHILTFRPFSHSNHVNNVPPSLLSNDSACVFQSRTMSPR